MSKGGAVKGAGRTFRVSLPINVFPIYGKGGQVYFYWQRGRNLPKAERSKLVRLRGDVHAIQDVFSHAAELNGTTPNKEEGTFDACILAYQSSPAWAGLSRASQSSYRNYLGRMETAWGRQLVADLSVRGACAFRDRLAEEVSPNTANQAMRCLSAFLLWCIPKGWATSNVTRDLKELEHEAETTKPWSEDAWRMVCDTGPIVLQRLGVLGRATGQRISDLCRLRPVDRRTDGFDFTITKTGKRHFIALAQGDASLIDGWNVPPMQFYINKGDGRRMSPTRVRRLLNLWQAQVLPDADLSPHGLRAMAICDARLRGLELQEIASLFGMSTSMVERYSRHMNVETASRAARARMEGK